MFKVSDEYCPASTNILRDDSIENMKNQRSHRLMELRIAMPLTPLGNQIKSFKIPLGRCF